MREFHGSEESFWQRMNPSRLGAMLDAILPRAEKTPEKKVSLSQYLRGG